MMDVALICCVFLAALLFSSVGQAGASGYLAAMALFELPPNTIRPSVLLLNILVSAIGTFQFSRAGHFSWSLFWPFAVTAIPLAYVGGTLTVSSEVYNRLVGVILLISALRLFVATPFDKQKPLPVTRALFCRAAIGLLSGITGTGGGVFLAPLLLYMGWAGPKTTAAISSAFILVNSIAAFVGLASTGLKLPSQFGYWAIAVIIGGTLGGAMGTSRMSTTMLSRALGAVLLFVGLKQLID